MFGPPGGGSRRFVDEHNLGLCSALKNAVDIALR
jgi:hypothetical protein